MKITLDAGHGKNINKGIVKEYWEGNEVFKLAHYLKDELEKLKDETGKGIEVVLTRDDLEQNPTVAARGLEAATNGSELFISLHTNASGDSSAHGVTVFYSIKRPASFELGERLGKAVTDTMWKKTGITYLRGVKTRVETTQPNTDWYGVIRNSVLGANVLYSFIIEHGFHTNLKECEYLMNDENKRELAKAEAKVIAEYFNLTPIKETETLYCVQVGAYKKKENANKMLEKIKEAGFNGYITTKERLV